MSKEIDSRVAEHMRRADEHAEQEARKQSLGRIVGGLYADAGVNVRALREGEFERSREAFGTALAAAHEQIEALTAERDQLRKLVQAVCVSEFDGVSTQDVNGVNWWDARRAALRTADEGDGK